MPPVPPIDADPTADLAARLIDAFGQDVLRVVERQIEEAEGKAREQWIAVWELLAGPEDRRP